MIILRFCKDRRQESGRSSIHAQGWKVIFLSKIKSVRIARIFIFILIFSIFLPLGPSASAGYIRYVEFNPTLPVLEQAMEYDIASHTDENAVEVSWIDLLAYAAAKSGGHFEKKRSASIDELYTRLCAGETLDAITDEMEYFSYYQKAYGAVLKEFLGWHTIEVWDDTPQGRHTERRYGLRAFCPIARGYDFSHYEDFGASRSYGYRRPHLGNDMLGAIGTPIIAVESGVVEALGWNMYGGWRIGIRSFDGQRYYYYAHLRSNHPYHMGLDEGSIVSAGDVIGYLGMTGYSTREGTNNIQTPHLHFGLQLIFDEVQKDGVNQIWVDVYALTELLRKNRCAVEKTEDGDYRRVYNFADRSCTQPADAVFAPDAEALPCAQEQAHPSGAGEELVQGYDLPVIMYHSLIPDSSRYGKYVIPPSLLEQDLAYLQAHGYTAVSSRELLAYTDRGVPLPEKPVLISFDDGYYNNYQYLPELLEKYKMSAVVAPVGYFTDIYTKTDDKSIYYGIANWPELAEMLQCPYIELANHSYDQHADGKLLQGEAFVEDVGKMQQLMLSHLGRAATIYAYPYGRMPKGGDELVRRNGIRITLSCIEKHNWITQDPETLFSLGRYNRPYGISTEKFMTRVLP